MPHLGAETSETRGCARRDRREDGVATRTFWKSRSTSSASTLASSSMISGARSTSARAPNLARRRVRVETRSLSRGGSIRGSTTVVWTLFFVINARNRRLRTHHGTRSRGCVTDDHDTRPSLGCHAAVHLQSARSPRPASVRLDVRRVAKRLAGGRRIDLARVAQPRVRSTRKTATPARARARPGARPRRVRAQS